MSSRSMVSRWRRRTAVRDQLGDLGHLVAALLDGVQRFKSHFKVSLSCSYHCETRA